METKSANGGQTPGTLGAYLGNRKKALSVKYRGGRIVQLDRTSDFGSEG